MQSWGFVFATHAAQPSVVLVMMLHGGAFLFCFWLHFWGFNVCSLSEDVPHAQVERYKIRYPDFRTVKMWKNMCLRINELYLFKIEKCNCSNSSPQKCVSQTLQLGRFGFKSQLYHLITRYLPWVSYFFLCENKDASDTYLSLGKD